MDKVKVHRIQELFEVICVQYGLPLLIRRGVSKRIDALHPGSFIIQRRTVDDPYFFHDARSTTHNCLSLIQYAVAKMNGVQYIRQIITTVHYDLILLAFMTDLQICNIMVGSNVSYLDGTIAHQSIFINLFLLN